MKRQKHFYNHLIELDTLSNELDTLALSTAQKEELLEIAHVHVHQSIMDAILMQLKDSDKKTFLELVAVGADEKIWKHLNEKVEKIEDKIVDAADGVKKVMKEDIAKIR